jgi:hypothetical protein
VILEAIELQREISVRPELARSYVSYAVLLNAKEEHEKAREVVGNAITIFARWGCHGICSGRSVCSKASIIILLLRKLGEGGANRGYAPIDRKDRSDA